MADENGKTIEEWKKELVGLAEEEKWEALLEAAGLCVKEHENEAMGYFYKGYAQDELEDYEEAIKCYDIALELNPRDSTAHSYRGYCANQLGWYEDAINGYDKAIALDYNDSVNFTNRGYAKDKFGYHVKALGDYSRAIDLDPQNELAYFHLGQAHVNLKRYQDALSDFSQAINLEPKYEEAYTARGYVQSLLGQYNDSIADCNQAIALNPYSDTAYNNRGGAKTNLEQFDEAIADYDRAIALNETDPSYYHNRATAIGKKSAKESLRYISNTQDIISIYKNEIQFSYIRLFGDDSSEVTYWNDVLFDSDSNEIAQTANAGGQNSENLSYKFLKWFKLETFIRRKGYLNLSAANASSRLRWSVIAIVLFVSAVFYAIHKETNSWAIGEIGFQHIFQYTTVIAILAAPFFLHTRQIIRRSEEERTIAHALTRDMISLLFWNAQEPDDRSSNRAKLENAMLHHIGTNSMADVSLRMMGRKRTGAGEALGDEGRLSFMESTLQNIKSQLDVIKGQQKGGDYPPSTPLITAI